MHLRGVKIDISLHRSSILYNMAQKADLPQLDTILDKRDWADDKIRWYQSCNSLRILAVGRSGVGKSSIINAMFCNRPSSKRAPVGTTRDPTTLIVANYKEKVGGVELNFFDSPGLRDGKKKDDQYVDDMRRSCTKINLLLYCVRMDDQFRDDDKETIRLVSKALGNDVWKHAMCVLTFANKVEEDMSGELTPTAYFAAIFADMKAKIRSFVYKETRCRSGKCPPRRMSPRTFYSSA